MDADHKVVDTIKMDDSALTENSDEMEYQEDDDEDDNDYYYNYDTYADSGGDQHHDGMDTNQFGADFETLQGLECLNMEQAKNLLNEHVDQLSSKLHISPSLAKLFLHLNEWNVSAIVTAYTKHTNAFLVDNRVKLAAVPAPGAPSSASCTAVLPSSSKSSNSSSTSVSCPVCTHSLPPDHFRSLTCGHSFCQSCWAKHFEVQINQGITLDISCMASNCNILVPETLILTLLRPSLHDKYEGFSFRDFVSTHPSLRFCPGPNCSVVMRARESKPKRATCSGCATSFCFQCGIEYHAPTDCVVIKKWLTKCADDSETANYISAHTKDCPKCHICIEKNGGCNHMQCYHCKHEFCWMCLGDWKQHGSEYYECSRYKENPNIGRESAHAQAREALKKYLHYYERWENHAKSLKLESALIDKIKSRIHSKVMTSSGTWIDWQYLIDASTLLARCRYTLQYTYPYAYYMESSVSHSRKELFEYQQAQLEAEIENLSWKVERAETTDRGDLENQMDIAEKRRITLLKDFHLSSFSNPTTKTDVPPQLGTTAPLSSNQGISTKDTSTQSADERVRPAAPSQVS
uniref:RBR-type E3 ubiquitin transferase n=1 Tax=Cacopsylla melanoneura TaxID=428564 RepID=A0A8D9ETM3_9HEMI